MADDTGLLDIVSSFQTSVTGSADYSGSVNTRRSEQRNLYNRFILGQADKTEVGQTGTGKAAAPEWTKTSAGLSHAYRISEHSSSMHEVTRLNTFLSGTTPLENSPVPASGNMFYEKGERFVKKIYKLSASILLPVTPALTREPSLIEYVSPRPGMDATSKFHPASGSYRNNHYWDPARFEINVPDEGTIRDVKVWVELIHDHRSGIGDLPVGGLHGGIGTGSFDHSVGLQGLQIALRSPSTFFENAHPLWNEPSVSSFKKNTNISASVNPSLEFRKTPSLLKNSYLLWAGHAVEGDLGETLGHLTASAGTSFYDGFDTQNIVGSDLLENNVKVQSAITISHRIDCVVDSSQYLHAVYIRDATNDEVIYSKRSNNKAATWTNTIANTSGSASYSNCKIAVGRDGKPHIIYSDNVLQMIRYLYINTGGSFQVEDVFSSTSAIIANTDITVGPDNTVYVVLTDNNERSVKFFKRTAVNTWPEEFVANYTPVPTSSISGQVSIRLTSKQEPVIAFIDLNASMFNSELVYCTKISENVWTRDIIARKENVNDESPFTSHLAMCIDSSDRIYLIYLSIGNIQEPSFPFGIRVAILDGGIWRNEKISEFFDKFGIDQVSGDCYLKAFCSDDDSVYVGGQLDFTPSGNNPTKFIDRIKFFKRVTQDRWSEHYVYDQGHHIDGGAGFKWSVMGFDKKDESPVFVFWDIGMEDVRLIERENNTVLAYPQYVEFDEDIDIRTIFSDASNESNPRHLKSLYETPNGLSEVSEHRGELFYSGNYNSPTLAARGTKRDLTTVRNPIKVTRAFSSQVMRGDGTPWFLDNRTYMGSLVTPDSTGSTNNASNNIPPPTGWLTGPGGTAGINEFLTKGPNLGPETIKPVYPILDDIFVEKRYHQDPPGGLGIPGSPEYNIDSGSLFVLNKEKGRLVGFRPGLRGTQSKGKWTLLIGNTSETMVGSPFMRGTERGGFWFRQFRLELTIDTKRKGDSFNPVSSQKFNKRNADRPRQKLIQIMSGSATWDIGINYVYTKPVQEHGRTVGITDGEDFSQNTMSVFSRITGSLASSLPDTSFYLSNEFGTPYIPDSLMAVGSGSDFSFSTPPEKTDRTILDAINPQTLIPRANNLKAVISRSDFVKTTRERVAFELSEDEDV